jgi:hypothetical protein
MAASSAELWSHPGGHRNGRRPMSSPAIDLRVDFNAEDETGFPWT